MQDAGVTVGAIQLAAHDFEAQRAFMAFWAARAGITRYGILSGRISGGGR
jgi:hypothetical protein